MDFRTLEAFVWIARLGSFRATAQRLYTTQPSISTRIASLERELGVQLFDRAGRRVSLTSKGRDLLGYAEGLLVLRGEMMQSVADPKAIQGTIRLGVVETIVYTWLPQLIEQLNQMYPAINLELDVDTSVNLTDKLLSHNIDIAFLMGPINQPDITNLDLCSYSLNWVASSGIILPPEPVPLERLASWPIITYPRLSQPHIEIQRLLERSSHRLRIHASSSLATIIRMTVDGIGISALPLEIVRDELEQGSLRSFLAEVEPPQLRFTASYGATLESPVSQTVATLATRIAASQSVADKLS